MPQDRQMKKTTQQSVFFFLQAQIFLILFLLPEMPAAQNTHKRHSFVRAQSCSLFQSTDSGRSFISSCHAA